MPNLTPRASAAIVLLSMILPGAYLQAADYEQPPVLSADTLFPDIELQGDNYKVQQQVPTDGFMTRAVIKSDYGEFIAVGPGMLKVRLNEIDALASLQTLESSEEFKRGARESVDEKAGAFKKLYEQPGETAAGIGEGVSRFFKRTSRAAKTGIQTVDDVIHDRSPGGGDLEGPGAGLPGAGLPGAGLPGAGLPGKGAEEPGADEASKYEKAARASGNAAVNILGFDNSRRKLAKRLGVDPYTTNPVLNAKLDEVTWSIFAGDLGIDIATSLIPGSVVVTTSTLATNWVWDTPPGDLRVRIEEELLAVGVSQDSIDRLLRHRAYPLSYQAALTSAMKTLGAVDGITSIMPLALSVPSVGQARYVVNTLRMLASYHESVQPLESLFVDGTVIARNSDGATVIVAPVDYLSWTAVLDTFAGKERFKNEAIELHVAGSMSEICEAELGSRGWQLNKQSGLLGLKN